MGFDIDDSKLLLVSGIATATYAAHAGFAPRHLSDLYMGKEQAYSEPMTRWFGVALGSASATNIVLSTGDYNDKRVVKDALKVAGAGWAVSSAMMAYNANGVQEGLQTKELAWASAAGMAAMSALCLWRGFKEDE